MPAISKYASTYRQKFPNIEYEEEEDTPVEGEVTKATLKKLKKVFQQADEDKGGGLDMEEFRGAMRITLGEHVTDEELDRIFMKVDTNCDGAVDWDEYISYMLLEYTEKDAMIYENKPKPLPNDVMLVPNMRRYQRHHDSIIKIDFMPIAVRSTSSIYDLVYDSHGRYVTVSKSGVINFWSMEVKCLKRYTLPAPESVNKIVGLWVTCMTLLPNVNLIAIANTAGTITFYDITAYRFKPMLVLTDLEIYVTCISYWSNPYRSNNALLLFGDARGNVMSLEFDECSTMCFLTEKHTHQEFFTSKLLKSGACGVKAYKLPNIHQESVIDARFFPNLHGWFLSCCRIRETALYMGDIEGKKSVYFEVHKGVETFDYCCKLNTIVTGGKDTLVRVWNPYVRTKPVVILQGQKSPIAFVFIDQENEHIVSISQDKDIIIFDMLLQISIQSINRKHVAMGPRVLSAACFNTYRKALILGSNVLASFEHQLEDHFKQALRSHSRPVWVVAYNRLFDQIVTGGSDSTICVWDVNTGERVMQYSAYRQREGEIEIGISAMRFDPTLRRLITGIGDGSVKIWNFNNGALLRTLNSDSAQEITGIACPPQRILTAGWNRNITVYVDSYDDDTVIEWSRKHREDITAMDFKAPSTVVTGSHDGDILIWTLETGLVTIRFNANVSAKTCSIAKKDIGKVLKADDKRRLCISSDLDNWMAYNTHRDSIAEIIPFYVRRQSMYNKKPSIFATSNTSVQVKRKKHLSEEEPRQASFPLLVQPRKDIGHISSFATVNININNNVAGTTCLNDQESGDTSDCEQSLQKLSDHDTKAFKRNKNYLKGEKTISDKVKDTSKSKPLKSSKKLPSNKATVSNKNKNTNTCRFQKLEAKFSHFDNTSELEQLSSSKKSNLETTGKMSKLLKDVNDTNNANNNNTVLTRRNSSTEINESSNNSANRFQIADSSQTLFRKVKITDKSSSMCKPTINVSLDESDSGINMSEIRCKYDAYMRRNETIIEKLMFLEKREASPETATLIAVCAAGWIRFWSVHHKGGLLGQFNAAHNPGASVQAACLDEAEEFLVTGDYQGYIKVWDIHKYCNAKPKSDSETAMSRKEKLEQFPLLFEEQHKLLHKHTQQSRHRPPPQCTNAKTTWFAPQLLNSFRGHLEPINDIAFIEVGRRIATASSDYSIRVWTIYGTFIGVCGKETPWEWSQTVLGIESDVKVQKKAPKKPPVGGWSKIEPIGKMPGDVRRVASATTLRILNGGNRPFWKLAKNVVLVWLPKMIMLKKLRPKTAKHVQSETEKRVEEAAQEEVTEVKNIKESAILGKYYLSTRKARGHYDVPQLWKTQNKVTQCRVFKAIECHDLDPIEPESLKPPQSVVDIQERNRCAANDLSVKPRLTRCKVGNRQRPLVPPVKIRVN